jgi:hypothetical protein
MLAVGCRLPLVMIIVALTSGSPQAQDPKATLA